MDERRIGVAAGLAAYLLWGMFPLYFPLLEPAGGLEIVAHRIAWSLLFVGLLLTVRRGWPQVRAALTDQGRTLFDRMAAGHEAEVARIFAPLDDDDLDAARDVLRKLTR